MRSFVLQGVSLSIGDAAPHPGQMTKKAHPFSWTWGRGRFNRAGISYTNPDPPGVFVLYRSGLTVRAGRLSLWLRANV